MKARECLSDQLLLLSPGAEFMANGLNDILVQNLRCPGEQDIVLNLDMRLIKLAKTCGD